MKFHIITVNGKPRHLLQVKMIKEVSTVKMLISVKYSESVNFHLALLLGCVLSLRSLKEMQKTLLFQMKAPRWIRAEELTTQVITFPPCSSVDLLESHLVHHWLFASHAWGGLGTRHQAWLTRPGIEGERTWDLGPEGLGWNPSSDWLLMWPQVSYWIWFLIYK